MPIKPENRARYPKDWPALSMAARERARWRCQHPGCTATQYSVGRWVRFAGGQHEWRPLEGNRPATTAMDREMFMAGEGRDAHGERWTYGAARAFIDRWAWADDDRPLVIVLTVAHMGLPAHIPVKLHVTRATQADEVVELVGFLMPLKPELPEWAHMMHRRALAEFSRGPQAGAAGFFVALPSSHPGALPTVSVSHQPFAMSPQAIRLTDWCLLSEPSKAAVVAAKTAASIQVEPADVERLTTALAETLSETAFRAAQCFVATGIRASALPVRNLLRREREHLSADVAASLGQTLALCASNSWPRDAHAPSGSILQTAAIRAGLSWPLGVVREGKIADPARHDGRAGTWSGHAASLVHADEYPENCSDENLAAMCQRHHLAYDHDHHRANSQATRRAKAGTLELF